ncbi:MAG: hypothetical protein HC932_06285 [Thermales bacterium]|nr:hypothetical protein [Thermales bacterium]
MQQDRYFHNNTKSNSKTAIQIIDQYNIIYFDTYMQIHQPKITQFENSEVFYNKATEIIIDQILDTTSQEGLARICLSGGSTPLPIYNQLSKNSNLNWYDIELFQTDERFIDPSSEESNQFQIEKALTPKILDNLKHFYKINTTLEKKTNT